MNEWEALRNILGRVAFLHLNDWEMHLARTQPLAKACIAYRNRVGCSWEDSKDIVKNWKHDNAIPYVIRIPLIKEEN